MSNCIHVGTTTASSLSIPFIIVELEKKVEMERVDRRNERNGKRIWAQIIMN